MDNSYTTDQAWPTLGRVQWDRLFEDLEGQLSSEWEAERAALDAESERLRIARLDLRSRIRRLCASNAQATIDLPGGVRVRATLLAVGADWIAASATDEGAARALPTTRIIPVTAVRAIGTDHGALLDSLDGGSPEPSPLRERMTLGFLLRDLARRRVPLHLVTVERERLHGTVDRAGADHLDLALHDAGDARRAASVRGFRIVPFAAIAWAQLASSQLR